MTQRTKTPTIAFLGATGGVANSTLVHTLKAGHQAVALVRTPEKLKNQLLAQGLDEATIANQLTFKQGNALDVAAVKEMLLAGGRGSTVKQIVSGLGGAPSFQFNWRNPLRFFTIDDPSVCESGAKTLITALQELHHEQPEIRNQKPALVFVSTTGITKGPEDVPFLLRFLYHQVLHVPHQDKIKMEDLYRGQAKGQDSVFRVVSAVRPTLLTGGVNVSDAIGLDKVRAGPEAKPELGYSIKRADVGHWIFTNLINEDAATAKWKGEMVSLSS